ncbi:efflux RND transporter periplasmic adaptor subunit [Parachryseolinea silvisoli]|uniref:efflux RND transporter periplasmic adaptor subunit n=1 Tax=Parachryseolinea silvisoli TaxID=2873601 RepID=UPI002265AEF9|nr:efflux RND transporter periplasmic adaptor subunit [Parachryseolinea silvisoli]MCD9015154.1 efflux RND transporter periplasmic adaptor subunit [Parachryseolinea silvisoli]
MNRFASFFLLAAIALSCSEKKETSRKSAGVEQADSIKVFALKKDSVSKVLKLPAELHPWERAEIYAKVEGYVKELKVDIGDKVKKNDVLLILDAPEVTANYAKASADLQAARAKYHTSRDTYKRYVIASKEKGAISDNEMERTHNQMLTDSANYMGAQSSAGAYNQLKNYLVIRSAFDGIVTQRNVDPGTLVGKGQKPLIVVENLSKLRLRVSVPEAYTTAILATESVQFTVDAQPSKKYHGKLSRKSNQIDQNTRTELWEFEVPNINLELKSGMYGSVNFTVLRSEESFVAPYSAIVTNLERTFVIRVTNNQTEWVDVRTGINMKDNVEIFGHLNEGDQLTLKANDEIKPKKNVVSFQ